MVPQGAEPRFHVCRRRRFEDLSELQSAGASRTPQALDRTAAPEPSRRSPRARGRQPPRRF